MIASGCTGDDCAASGAASASDAAQSFVAAIADRQETCGFTGENTRFSEERLDEFRDAIDSVSDIEALNYTETSDFADTATVHVLTEDLQTVISLEATAHHGGPLQGQRWSLTGDQTASGPDDPTSSTNTEFDDE